MRGAMPGAAAPSRIAVLDIGKSNLKLLVGIPSTGVVFERPGGGADLVMLNAATGSAFTISGYFANANFANIALSDGVLLTVDDTDQLLRGEAIGYLTSTNELVVTFAQKQAQLACLDLPPALMRGHKPERCREPRAPTCFLAPIIILIDGARSARARSSSLRGALATKHVIAS
jgi:hypothetical protein